MPLIELVSSDIKQAVERFDQFHQRFAQYFATKTRTVAHRAKQYMQGQLQYLRFGNMVQFEKIVPDSDHQSLQHFASNSPWEDEPILDDVCETVPTTSSPTLPPANLPFPVAHPRYCSAIHLDR